MPLIEASTVHVGQEVLYIPCYPKSQHEKYWQILTIERITGKAQQIVTSDDRRFDREGMEIGGETSFSGGKGSLHKLTNEHRTRIKQAQHLELIQQTKWDQVDPETLRVIMTLLTQKDNPSERFGMQMVVAGKNYQRTSIYSKQEILPLLVPTLNTLASLPQGARLEITYEEKETDVALGDSNQ